MFYLYNPNNTIVFHKRNIRNKMRSPDELGLFQDEQKLAEKLGLYYLNVPMKLEALNEELITKTIENTGTATKTSSYTLCRRDVFNGNFKLKITNYYL